MFMQTINTWGRALAVVASIEVGLLLLTLPWTAVWDHNFWLGYLTGPHPGVVRDWLSPYARGAASGLGLVNLWAAASEITGVRL